MDGCVDAIGDDAVPAESFAVLEELLVVAAGSVAATAF